MKYNSITMDYVFKNIILNFSIFFFIFFEFLAFFY
jgi:hypothetical protein